MRRHFNEKLELVEELVTTLSIALAFAAVDAPTPPDPYLGLLTIGDGVSIYGFLLNTKSKILVAINDSKLLTEDEVKSVRCACGCVCWFRFF